LDQGQRGRPRCAIAHVGSGSWSCETTLQGSVMNRHLASGAAYPHLADCWLFPFKMVMERRKSPRANLVRSTSVTGINCARRVVPSRAASRLMHCIKPASSLDHLVGAGETNHFRRRHPNASTITEDILDPPIGNEPHYCNQDIDGDR